MTSVQQPVARPKVKGKYDILVESYNSSTDLADRYTNIDKHCNTKVRIDYVFVSYNFELHN